MGSSNSKAHYQSDDQVKAIRRQIGKRSSVKFLQKADSQILASRPTSLVPQSHLPYMLKGPPRPLSSHPPSFPALSPTSTRTVLRAPEGAGHARIHRSARALSVVGQRSLVNSVSPISGHRSNISTEPRGDCNADTGFNCPDHDTVLADTPSLSDGSSAPEPVDVHDLAPAIDYSLVNSNGSAAATPVAKPIAPAVTPILRMFTPLPHDSPTRYGFDRALAIAQAEALDKAQTRALTGPELFRRTSDRYRLLEIREPSKPQNVPATKPRKIRAAGCVPCRIYRPQRSKLSPTELFQRTQKAHHPLPKPQQKENDPRIHRLLRRAWPYNLFRDNTSVSTGARVALAVPLTPVQLECHSKHGHWRHATNLPTPVECAVCLRASDSPADRAGSWLCDCCALRVCAECKAVFDTGGTNAMMARFADGSQTIEGRKAKAKRAVMA